MAKREGNISEGLIPSDVLKMAQDINLIKEKLKNIISQEDITSEDAKDDFRSLLMLNFIYSIDDNNHYVYRQMLETLIAEHTTFFLQLIRDLYARLPVSEALVNEMLYVMDNFTDFNPFTLLSWKASTKNHLKMDKASIYYYAELLSTEEDDEKAQRKSAALHQLFNDMEKILKSAPNEQRILEGYSEKYQVDYAKHLEILDIKLQLLEAINKAKPALEGHRGYRKIMINIMLGLFGLIPQTLNYFFTGNFWFANKTTSENEVQKVISETGCNEPLLFDDNQVDPKQDDLVGLLQH